jgi:hypothetical protein
LDLGKTTRPGSNISSVHLQLETTFELSEGELVANAEVQFADGTKKLFPVRYGWHVRAAGDNRPTIVSPTAGFPIPAQTKPIRQIVLTPTSRYAGLNLKGYGIESGSLP